MWLHITFVFPIFTLSPFHSIASFQLAIFILSSSSFSATTTKSSAYSSSHGSPVATCFVIACITIIKNKGLSTAPWWTPNFTSKSSDKPFPTLTAVLASTYVRGIFRVFQVGGHCPPTACQKVGGQ